MKNKNNLLFWGEIDSVFLVTRFHAERGETEVLFMSESEVEAFDFYRRVEAECTDWPNGFQELPRSVV
jgi:hypothetical protein